MKGTRRIRYPQQFLHIYIIVSLICFGVVLKFQRSVNAADGEADHVEHIGHSEDTETATSIFIPLQTHQLSNRSKIKDHLGLRKEARLNLHCQSGEE